MNKNERQMIGLQHSSYEEITTYLKKKLIDHFQNKIGTTFSIFNQTDEPYTMFNMQFTMYKYFNVILNYDRECFGFSIINVYKVFSCVRIIKLFKQEYMRV